MRVDSKDKLLVETMAEMDDSMAVSMVIEKADYLVMKSEMMLVC
jgi:hypothetical protein